MADSPDLVARKLPGDDVPANAELVTDRALELRAAPTEVWPWLVQLGKHRGGWYMPRSVERIIPKQRRATRRIESRWQVLHVGAAIPDWRPGDPTFEVLEHEPGRSRLHLRLRVDLGGPPGPVAKYGGRAVDAATVWFLGRGLNERLG